LRFASDSEVDRQLFFIGSAIGQKQFPIAQEISLKSGASYSPPPPICLWFFKLKGKVKMKTATQYEE